MLMRRTGSAVIGAHTSVTVSDQQVMIHLSMPIFQISIINWRVSCCCCILCLDHNKCSVKTLQFLNHCMSCINRMRHKKLALPTPTIVDTHNGQNSRKATARGSRGNFLEKGLSENHGISQGSRRNWPAKCAGCDVSVASDRN